VITSHVGPVFGLVPFAERSPRRGTRWSDDRKQRPGFPGRDDDRAAPQRRMGAPPSLFKTTTKNERPGPFRNPASGEGTLGREP